MTKKTAAELFGADVVVLAVLLHLAERSKELNEGPFRAGWDSAIEEAASAARCAASADMAMT